MRAMILAAGFGERLRPLTLKLPKPLLPVLGKPLIQHNIEWLRKNGINEIALNLHHLPHKITSFLGTGSKFGVKITYSYEKEILGTAGGVKKLEGFFDGTFLVYYGDNITNLDIGNLLEFHKHKKAVATICLHPIKKKELKEASIIELSKENRILRFIEKPDSSTIKKLIKKNSKNIFYSNAGIYMLEPSVLKFIEKNKFSDFAKDVFPKLLKSRQKIYGYPLKDCYWHELGTLQKYKNVIKKLIKQKWR